MVYFSLVKASPMVSMINDMIDMYGWDVVECFIYVI